MRKIYLLLCFFIGTEVTTSIHAQTITTIAGTGLQGYNGDNIAASIAQIGRASGVKVDANGNVYIADYLNNRIRKIGTNGFISTIAGTGTAGYNGDNMAGSITNLNLPEAIALDTFGNVFIEDTYNHRIRKLGTNGFITTVAGNGVAGYNGDNRSAIDANLNYPSDGILIDPAGNIIISDSYNNRIRKVSTTGIITTIAGTGTAGYNGDNILAVNASIYYPYALALDADGNLYFADGLNHRIRKINTAGIITTMAGTGTAGYNGDNMLATSARLNTPEGIAFDAAGNLFISDYFNHRIRRVDKNTGLITTVVGTGVEGYNGDNIAATAAQINYPVGITIDKFGSLFIADFVNNRIRKVTNVGPILPLTLTHISASLQNGKGLLQWQTTNEVNTQKFVIEVSHDGLTFTPLDSVNAKSTMGSNTYSFTDVSIKSGVTYYRLKMIDRDGKFTYSNVVSLRLNQSISIGISSNPVSNIANLSFTASVAGKYTIQIVDMAGKVIHQIGANVVVGSNKLTFDTHGYSKGEYILTLANSEGMKASIKFIK